MKLPRHPWLIWLYRSYARVHRMPDPYARGQRLFEGMRTEIDRMKREAYYAQQREAIQRVGPLMDHYAQAALNQYPMNLGANALQNAYTSQIQAQQMAHGMRLGGSAYDSLGLLGLAGLGSLR